MKSLVEKRHRAAWATGVMAGAIAMAAPARALTLGPAASEFGIDPSMRSQAMGGASGAVFWGRGPNDWANPALLGLAEGITYENGTTGGENYDYGFNAERWTVGQGGVGFATAGHPFTGLGGLGLVYDGGPRLDEIRTWGIGLSVSRVAASLAALRHAEAPGFARYADVAFGYARKKFETLQGNDFDETAVGVDWGVLARGSVPFHLGPGEVPARVEAGYSYSVQNSNDVNVSVAGVVLRAERPRRHGVAVHFALDLPASWRDRIPAWLAPGFEPLISLGGAWDRESFGIGNEPPRLGITHLGGELGLGNVAFVRLGSRSGFGPTDFTISASSQRWGYGLALPVGRLGGVQYEEARLEEFYSLPATTSRAWRVWLSPMEIVRALR